MSDDDFKKYDIDSEDSNLYIPFSKEGSASSRHVGNVYNYFLPLNFLDLIPSLIDLEEYEYISSFLKNKKKMQLFDEILRSYTYRCFIPCILGCRALLESVVNQVLDDTGEKRKELDLNQKIKKLSKLEKETRNIAQFQRLIANKAAHRIFESYKEFDKPIATMILNLTIITIKEIKNKYYGESTTGTKEASSN